MESADIPSRLTATQRDTLAAHVARYPNAGSVIWVKFPRLWRAARRAGMTAADIRSACHDGLMRAAAKYTGRYAFTTFAVRGSRWAVLWELARRTASGRPVPLDLGGGERVSRFAVRSLEDAPQWQDAGRALTLADHRETLRRLMRGLRAREVEVLVLRYGLRDGVPLTLGEVGKRLGLTQGRVWQLEVNALRQLRHVAEEHGIDLTTEAT